MDDKDKKDAKIRLTELARRHFNDDTVAVDPDFYTATYGKTLREMLEDPRLGEKAVLEYWDFKMNGGYE